MALSPKGDRRQFLKSAAGALGTLGGVPLLASGENSSTESGAQSTKPVGRNLTQGTDRDFAAAYEGECLNHIAFPLGGIGAGMVCLEGTGTLSHVSVRNRPDLLNEPQVFAALYIKGERPLTRVLEGPVPHWKLTPR